MTSPDLACGEISRRCSRRGAIETAYFVYMPRILPKNPGVFVSVHGISRNAEEHARLFAPFMDRLGMILIAPLFSERDYPRYQRLGGRRGNHPRADHALLEIVDEVAADLGIPIDQFYLFGFSGGGQFAHRFAMAHPHRIKAYVVAAAGWYTLPDPERKFPRGIGPNRYFSDIQIDLPSFVKVPGMVIVGERDNKQDTALNRNARISEEQGAHRLQRGAYWVQQMNDAAIGLGMNADFRFVVAPRCGHSFRRAMRRGGMGDVVVQRFFGEAANATTDASP